MNRDVEPAPVAVVAARLKPLPRQHRIAHLRALIQQQPAGSIRRNALAALLRDEMAPRSGKAGRIA
jgi:hypothetical protein